jgi:hypothetical protein
MYSTTLIPCPIFLLYTLCILPHRAPAVLSHWMYTICMVSNSYKTDFTLGTTDPRICAVYKLCFIWTFHFRDCTKWLHCCFIVFYLLKSATVSYAVCVRWACFETILHSVHASVWFVCSILVPVAIFIVLRIIPVLCPNHQLKVRCQ